MTRYFLVPWLLWGAASLAVAGVACSSGDPAAGGQGGPPASGGSTSTVGTGPGDAGADGSGGSGSGACGETLCGGVCVDLDTNDEHCGGCNLGCEAYEACLSGECTRVSCDEPLTLCEGECFDTDADVRHCGQCGAECDLTFECSGGSCACPDERIECGGSCAHPDFDRAHCGGCGSPCGADEACVGGECATIAVPANAYCSATSSWPSERTTREFEILDIVNRRRAEGAHCGARGYHPPVPPLQMHAALRCAARAHSQDMVDRDYFSHNSPNPGGTTPSQRMTAAGYTGSGWGENIAAGRSTAEQTMDQWMNSDGHCANIMSANYRLIGVGYAPNTAGARYGHYWTQTFGR